MSIPYAEPLAIISTRCRIRISRRNILQAAGVAALAPSALPAAEIPGPRLEGPDTPKICLEAGAGGLSAGGY